MRPPGFVGMWSRVSLPQWEAEKYMEVAAHFGVLAVFTRSADPGSLDIRPWMEGPGWFISLVTLTRAYARVENHRELSGVVDDAVQLMREALDAHGVDATEAVYSLMGQRALVGMLTR